MLIRAALHRFFSRFVRNKMHLPLSEYPHDQSTAYNRNHFHLFQPINHPPIAAPRPPGDTAGLRYRTRLKEVMFSRPADQFAMSVICLFVVVAGLLLSIDTGVETEWLQSMEVAILVVFLGGIVLKRHAVGEVRCRQSFYSPLWTDFDLMVVVMSLILVSISFSEGFQLINLLPIAATLRILRLALAFRKLSDLKSILTRLRISGNQTERVVEILERVRAESEVRADEGVRQAVSWCIDTIKCYSSIVIQTAAKTHRSLDEFATCENESSASPCDIPIYPQAGSQAGSEIIQCLSDIDSNDFDVFELKRLTEGNELLTVMETLFTRKRLFEQVRINENTFRRLMRRIQRGYNHVPYHNSTHAADVVQTLNYFLTTICADDLPCLPLETAACYLSAAVHDFEHPGVSNAYLINTQSEAAIRYNDKSVLENHHISAAFSLMLREKHNICSEMSPEEYSRMRHLMIEMVLSTDVAQHFTLVSKLKEKLPIRLPIATDGKNLCFQLLIHAADISNPSKPWDICHKWTELVMEEFWNQGDRERQQGLLPSSFTDRRADVGQLQVGFIDEMVAPTFESLQGVFPKLQTNCEIVRSNKAKWRSYLNKNR